DVDRFGHGGDNFRTDPRSSRSIAREINLAKNCRARVCLHKNTVVRACGSRRPAPAVNREERAPRSDGGGGEVEKPGCAVGREIERRTGREGQDANIEVTLVVGVEDSATEPEPARTQSIIVPQPQRTSAQRRAAGIEALPGA